MKSNLIYIKVVLFFALIISCNSQSGSSEVKYQCEIGDIKSINSGTVLIHQVSELESKTVRKSIEEIRELIIVCKTSETFPNEIGLLENLEVLTLAGGNFEMLPTEIGNLTKLKVLILVNTSLRFLPLDFYKIPTLHRLAIMYNLNEFEFQEELCEQEFELKVWKTSSNFSELPDCLKNQNRLVVEAKEAY